jgi:hypothetical protein
MKAKMQYDVQPRATVPPRIGEVQVQEEIQNFLRALDSYPARVAKEPRVSFQQHLCSYFAPVRHENDRRDNRPRRH